MSKQGMSKILILPEQNIAIKKTLVNAFFYGAGVVFLVMLLLFLFFPKFFLLMAPLYYSKFFVPQAVAFSFFVKIAILMFAIFLLASASYFILVFISLRQKEIGVILSPEGIAAHYGRMSRFVDWSKFKGVRVTTNPLLIKNWPSEKLLIYDVYELDKLTKRIEQYRGDQTPESIFQS